jgi:hypothetical protein
MSKSVSLGIDFGSQTIGVVIVRTDDGVNISSGGGAVASQHNLPNQPVERTPRQWQIATFSQNCHYDLAER